MPFYRPHDRVTLDTGDEMITKQSHQQECDIHNILGQYKRTGIITHVQSARATYTDLPSDLDYQQSLNTLLEAERAFAALPAKVRDHFKNDPAAFLAAFSDPKEEQTLVDFGLVIRTPEATTTPGAPQAPSGAPQAPST